MAETKQLTIDEFGTIGDGNTEKPQAAPIKDDVSSLDDGEDANDSQQQKQAPQGTISDATIAATLLAAVESVVDPRYALASLLSNALYTDRNSSYSAMAHLVSKWTRLDKQTTYPAGVHIIIGTPRSGKTTLLNDILQDPTSCVHVDEPYSNKLIGDKPDYVMYTIWGLLFQLDRLFSSTPYVITNPNASTVFKRLRPNDTLSTDLNQRTNIGLDSIRSVVHSLGGTTLKGGMSAPFKLLMVLLNNIARDLNRSLFVVLTTEESSALLDARGSAQSVIVVSDFKFCSIGRDALGVSPNSTNDTERMKNNFVYPSKQNGLGQLTYFDLGNVRITDASLVADAFRKDPLAVEAIKRGLDVQTYRQRRVRGDFLVGDVDIDVLGGLGSLDEIDPSENEDVVKPLDEPKFMSLFKRENRTLGSN